MTSRAAWILALLAGLPGCDLGGPHYDYRLPCELLADPEMCCPPGSHQVPSDRSPELIVCGRDEVPCGDAGADAGVCPEAGTDGP